MKHVAQLIKRNIQPGLRVRLLAGATMLCLCTPLLSATNDATNTAALTPPTPVPDTARGLYNAGTQKLDEGKLDDAEMLLQAALGKQDESLQPTALYNLGHVRFDQGAKELRKTPAPEDFVTQTRTIAAAGAHAVRQAEDALSGDDVDKMVQAYLAGRGVRREIHAAREAFLRAMQSYAATLLKWRRSLGDFRSTAELNPADTNAVRNAHIVEEHIAKLVDRIRRMQRAMMPTSGGATHLRQLMDQLRGRIPKDKLPPGAPGDDEDDDFPMEALRGVKEGPSKEGDKMELMLSPEEAENLLQGLRLGEGRRLPMSEGEPGQPKDRKGRTW